MMSYGPIFGPPLTPADRALSDAVSLWSEEVGEKLSTTPVALAPDMVETMILAAFDNWPPMARTVSKRDVIERFLDYQLREYDRTLAPETAEGALAVLVEHGFALVDGDQIIIPDLPGEKTG